MAHTPIHPGEILAGELEEINFTAKKLTDIIEVPPNRLYQILAGKRILTADTALRLSQYFGMPAYFWMKLRALTTFTWPGSRAARLFSEFHVAKRKIRVPQRDENTGSGIEGNLAPRRAHF